MVDHWFDTLNKRMRHGAPRRALIGVVVGTLARCTLGDDPRTDAAKKRTKRAQAQAHRQRRDHGTGSHVQSGCLQGRVALNLPE